MRNRMHVRAPSAELQARVPVSLYVFDVLEINGQMDLGAGAGAASSV